MLSSWDEKTVWNLQWIETVCLFKYMGILYILLTRSKGFRDAKIYIYIRLENEVLHIMCKFDDCSCTHICREKNGLADSLSKEGLQLVQGGIKISEIDNDSFY